MSTFRGTGNYTPLLLQALTRNERTASRALASRTVHLNLEYVVEKLDAEQNQYLFWQSNADSQYLSLWKEGTARYRTQPGLKAYE